MHSMSNNQWNNGQGDGQWQPEGNPEWNAAPAPGAGDWNQTPQGEPQATDWNQPAPQQDWNQAPQPQGSADWNQAPQPQTSADWNQAPQPQGSADWNQAPPAQDWNQAQQPQQDWNAQPGQDWNQAQPGQPAQEWNQAQAGQQWNQQPGQQWQQAPAQRPDSPMGNVFDFSFKKFALPEAGGTIFLIAVIAIGVGWLFDLVGSLQMGSSLGAGYMMQSIVGGLARAVLYILLARVLIEGASAVVKLANKSDAEPTDEA